MSKILSELPIAIDILLWNGNCQKLFLPGGNRYIALDFLKFGDFFALIGKLFL